MAETTSSSRDAERDGVPATARRRAYFFALAVAAALLHNVVHESVHLLAATLVGESVEAFRLFTNGWGTSQVVFATPVEARQGASWLVIAWTPAVVTTALGFLTYLNRRRLLGPWKVVNAFVFFVAVFFMMLDPFYFGVLSSLIGGDIGAAAAVGLPTWPVRAVALAVLALGVLAYRRWRGEARGEPDRYA